jgi:hypothetical protein
MGGSENQEEATSRIIDNLKIVLEESQVLRHEVVGTNHKESIREDLAGIIEDLVMLNPGFGSDAVILKAISEASIEAVKLLNWVDEREQVIRK